MTPWLTHHSAPLAAGCAFIAFTLAPALVAFVPWIAAITFLWIYAQRHRRLCHRCFAAMPLRPAEKAERHRWTLYLPHLLSDRPTWQLMGLLAAGTALIFVIVIGVPWVGGLLCGGATAWLILSIDLHQRLQPWCPWCRRGGGGDEEHNNPGPSDPHRRILSHH